MPIRRTTISITLAGLLMGCTGGSHPAGPAGSDIQANDLTPSATHIERVGSCFPDEIAERLLGTGNWEISPHIKCPEGETPIRVARG